MPEESNVVEFPGDTLCDISPDKVLQEAVGALKEVIVIGTGIDGQFYMASSSSSLGDNLLLLKLAERDLVDLATGD